MVLPVPGLLVELSTSAIHQTPPFIHDFGDLCAALVDNVWKKPRGDGVRVAPSVGRARTFG
jgi:hypothetical protein